MNNTNKKPGIFMSFIIIIVFVFLVVIGGMWAKKHPTVSKATNAPSQSDLGTLQSQIAQLTTPLKQIRQEGTGDPAMIGDTVSVLYVGELTNGKVFDTNIEEIAKQAGLDQTGKTYAPLSFVLGTTDIISGWNVAVTGMKVGEVAQVIIPASYAYGDQGFGSVIPPNSPLVFQIQVVDIQKAPAPAVSTDAKTDATAKTDAKTTTTEAKKK